MYQRLSISMLFLTALFFATAGMASEKEYGVYEYVVKKAQGSFEQVSADLHAAASGAGWKILAAIDAGPMEDCTYKARVFVLYNADYAKHIMTANSKTGPFAVLDRINLFEDEDGLNISIVNPNSINRTILLDNQKYEEMTDNHRMALRSVITSAVKGEISTKQYGEMRDRGYIGKTMGVVAGGPFNEKLEDEFVIPEGNPADIAAKIGKALQANGKEWGTHVVLSLPLPEHQLVILGIGGTPLDTESFEIVGSGDDDDRDDFACPGLAHAGAYPFELVVVKEGTDCKIRMVAPMFRMKIFFEDAGKWAFMKHMGMPGSIASEVTDRIKAELKLP